MNEYIAKGRFMIPVYIDISVDVYEIGSSHHIVITNGIVWMQCVPCLLLFIAYPDNICSMPDNICADSISPFLWK